MRSGLQYITVHNVTVTRSECKSWLRFGPGEVVGYNNIDSLEFVNMTVLTQGEIRAYQAFLPDMMDVSIKS